MSSSLNAMLLLADGRFPAGGHVHSAGVESAVEDRRIVDLASLAEYTAGRLRTVGLVEAALAAATVHRLTTWSDASGDVLAELDAEAEARILATPLREASRRQGRQLLRVASRCWPSSLLDAAAAISLHQPVAMGAVAASVGIEPEGSARLMVHHAVTTPTQAAVRLLGLDPYGAAAVVTQLSSLADEVVRDAVAASTGRLVELPAAGSPLLEIAAMEHRAWDSRMFAT